MKRALRYLAPVAAIPMIVAAYLITSGWLTGQTVAGLPAPSPTASPDSRPTALIAIRDLPLTTTATPTPTATPAISPTPALVDYAPLEAALNRYVDERVRARGFGVGIGFVDAQTGQTISLDGESRHYALSTFKGPLAAYYLWQVERGLIALTAEDATHIERMLEVSSNPDTTCVIKRVGGLAAFNDWLAYEGLSREQNFVMTWRSWPCEEDGESYTPEGDLRYSLGDAALGLPGGNALLRCSPLGLRCDKAFAPLELAGLYARLARGEVLDGESMARLLRWLDRERDESDMLAALPDDARIHAYTKNGFRAADQLYDAHFYHEAGLIDTGEGVFALAVFMSGNPDWPGTDVIGDITRLVYDYFVAARHGNEP